jgi:hypothetical protein
LKKFLTITVLSLLSFNISYAEVKNIGNGLSINIPNSYHYFEISLKQIVSRFPSINVSDFTNSDIGIGVNTKLVVLANNKKTIKLFQNISSVSGLARLKEDYWIPFEELIEDPEFENLFEGYVKKKFSKIDIDDISDEELQIIFTKVIQDKKFLKKIDKYIRPFIDKFNSEYEFDKATIILIGDKKIKFINDLKQLSVNDARNALKEGIKIMIKEDPSLKVYKNWKYEIGKNAKENLYVYSNDIDYLDATPMFKNLKYLKAADTILTTKNKKLITISSQCFKKCNSTDFLEIIGPLNLYKGLKTKTQTNLNTSDIASQLEQLNDLYKSGTLTKDEFDKAKKKILN